MGHRGEVTNCSLRRGEALDRAARDTGGDGLAAGELTNFMEIIQIKVGL